MKPQRRIILSISSDIGTALALDWLDHGFTVEGTFRTESKNCALLREKGAILHRCDLLAPVSVSKTVKKLSVKGTWQVLVLSAGTTEPIGPFVRTSFDSWAASIHANFTGPMGFLHSLLPKRDLTSSLGPLVVFFAGGGTNNATCNYSAYTLSKISLIKACELLDAELPDTRFSILGPGWVNTKIHHETIRAAKLAGSNYARTKEMIQKDKCLPIEKVVECCNWLVGSERAVIGGRNFSVVHDAWGCPALHEQLRNEPNMYKLRRSGN